MILYLDTSALVPLLIDEPTTRDFRSLWLGADIAVTTRLAYVEASSAIARARRSRRISDAALTAALQARDELWEECVALEIDDDLMRRSAEVAVEFGLRGYDAVHCAAAESISEADMVAASGDKALLAAWHELGITTISL